MPRLWSQVIRSHHAGERLHCSWEDKKSLPPALKQVQQLLAKGLKATAARLPATAERLPAGASGG